ncbi:MAG: aminoacetone oxidase family FAD-binding enzyme [Lachnospiraceae bacterium]|nr:aminoacetone oxidase family FAD-binding enzyme [Lachnospiraceae bacterium]
MYDLCVIGGGMSGMAAAITAAKAGKKVILFEKNKKLGKKLYATGNGRCNLTNMSIDLGRDFNSSYSDYETFIRDAFGDGELTSKVIEFFNSIGISTVNVDDTYVYPASMQASAVVWALIDALNNYNVEIVLNTKIKDIVIDTDETYIVSHSDMKITSKKLILANGSKAYPSLGGNDTGYKLAKKFGHNIIQINPALCGLITEEDFSPISGIRAKASAVLFEDGCGEVMGNEVGELQITDYGVSGIMMFNLSSKVGRLLKQGKKPVVCIDFLRDIQEQNNFTTIRSTEDIILGQIAKASKDRTILAFLNSFVNDKLAAYVCDLQGIDKKTKVSQLNDETINNLIVTLNQFKVTIKSLRDFESGQVCAGGVDLKEINPIDFSSKICPGLHIVGELLDMDGLCGGYNLTFAVLSGIAAGKAI